MAAEARVPAGEDLTPRNFNLPEMHPTGTSLFFSIVKNVIINHTTIIYLESFLTETWNCYRILFCRLMMKADISMAILDIAIRIAIDMKV